MAVLPPPSLRAVLAQLPRPQLAGVRWTTAAQWHITIRFLGQADVGAAVAALAGVTAPVVEVSLGPNVELFARSVLAVRAAGLDGLAARTAAAFDGIGTPAADRPFRGHLTLARLHASRSPSPADLRAAGCIGAPLAARFEADQVALVQSHTLAEGARYETVASRALGG